MTPIQKIETALQQISEIGTKADGMMADQVVNMSQNVTLGQGVSARPINIFQVQSVSIIMPQLMQIQQAIFELRPHTRNVDISVGVDYWHELTAFSESLIELAMQEANGSKIKAAQLLGINRTTLIEKLKHPKIKTLKKIEQ